MSQEPAIPVCLPNNTKWCERTGTYSNLEGVARDSLYVIEAAQRRLRMIKGPVCVVAIAGPSRRGKSYILSKVFGYENVFPLGHTLDPETMGVWMWVVPEKYKDEHGQELTVILLDSEGIDAVASKGSDDHKVFTLTVLLSSVLIYNSVGVPTRHDLEGLDFIVNLSQRIHCSATGSGRATGDAQNKQQCCKTFPRFVWLLRDVLLDLPSKHATLKDFLLDKVFNSHIDDNTKAQRAAESILELFKGFDAFMLPPPAYDPEVVKSLNDPSKVASVNPKFFSDTETFSRVLKAKLSPKTSYIDGEYVTGEALATLLDEYVSTLNTPGAVPNVQTAWQVFIQDKCSQAKMNAIELYEQWIVKIRNLVPCKAEIIRDQHYHVLEACLQLFHSDTEGISVSSTDEYLKQLTDEINQILCSLLRENEQITQTLCEELLQKLKQEILDPVLACLAGPGGAKLSYQDIMHSYSSLEAAYKEQATGAEDICAAVMATFHPQLQADMQKHMHLLENLKDYDEQITKEKEAKAREEASKKRFQEETKWLKNEARRKEKELEFLHEQKKEEEKRLREFYKTQMADQKDQYENLMKANMEKMTEHQKAMMRNNDQTAATVKMMNDLILSRDQQIAQLNQSVIDLAKQPPVVDSSSGGLFQSVGKFFDGIFK